MKYGNITESIIGSAFKVHNALGFGFPERVYENALALELRRQGLAVQQQSPVPVRYEGELVGDYVADLVVDGKVIVEVKAVSSLEAVREVRLVNYLKATGIGVGLLINSGRQAEVKRKVFDPC